jgi:hypothetical protein
MVAARKGPVYVTQQYAISQTEEPGVVISMRDYDRLIERLDGCRAGGWADLWLFGAGAGAALAAGALVTVLTMPVAQSGVRDVLWVLTGAGAVILVLCLVGYLTQRGDRGREISELRKDLEIRKPMAAAAGKLADGPGPGRGLAGASGGAQSAQAPSSGD